MTFSHNLRSELENCVNERTARRVQNFRLDLFPQKVVLHGRTTSFYVKQLAQQGIREVLPDVILENAITVD